MLGVSKVISPSLEDEAVTGPFEVWDDCWDSAMMFLRMSTDWVYAGMGTCVGMNKQTLQWYMDLYDVEKKREMLEDILVMERHALKLINKN